MLPLFAWGLAEIIAALRRRPMWLIGGAMLGLAMWNAQLAYIYNSMMVATRDDALTFDKVAEAQVELVYRRLLRAHRWMPSPVWVVLYDNLKGVWLHDGSRSFGGLMDLGEEPEGFYPLVGDGWFVPEFEDRISFRQSRGRRSWLTLLIRNPKDYVLTFRARREVEDFPVSARVDINGNALGELDLVAGWSTYRLEVPESVLFPGVNQLFFFYPETPRRRLPGFRGREHRDVRRLDLARAGRVFLLTLEHLYFRMLFESFSETQTIGVARFRSLQRAGCFRHQVLLRRV